MRRLSGSAAQTLGRPPFVIANSTLAPPRTGLLLCFSLVPTAFHHGVFQSQDFVAQSRLGQRYDYDCFECNAWQPIRPFDISASCFCF